MSIIQFLRIIWARRFVILGSIAIALVAALVVVQVLPPKYVARTQVMLNIIKPDPVTGQVIHTAFQRAYTKTQIELVKGEQVARIVVKDLEWAKDPKLVKEFRERDSSDTRDFERWAAQKVMDGASARLIDLSNILEISYTAHDPRVAKQVTDALSKAYTSSTLEDRRETAKRNADWYDIQAEKAKTELLQAEAARANFERTNGILLQDDKTDLDSARLSALASAAAVPVVAAPPAAVNTGTSMQLAQLDAQIDEASKVLGPNHPQLQDLRRRREILANQEAQERRAVAPTGGGSAAIASMFESQKNRVMAQREQVERLRLLQSDVELRRAQYTRAAARAADLRQEAEVADAGVTPLGSAVSPTSPEFPNKPVILIGALVAGAAVGFGGGLALELIGRRVRSADDLRSAVKVPVLGIISPKVGFERLSLRQRLSTRLALLNRRTRVA